MRARHPHITLLALSLSCLGPALATSALAEPARGERTRPASSSRASDVAQAERHAAQAFEAYRQHDYERAVKLYSQALAAAPSADILYNIARVYDLGLGDRRLAIEYYEAFVTMQGAAPKRVQTARQRLSELRAVERSPEPPPADTIAREFPLDEPTPAPAPAPERPLPPPERHALTGLEVAAISIGTAGLVGVGVGVGFGLAARSETDAWRDACDGNQCSSQRGVDAAESAGRRARIATIGFGVGGGLLTLATVLWLVDDGEEESREPGVRVSPSTDGSSVGGVVSGAF